MSGASLTFDVQGLPQLKARIDKLASRSNFNELLEGVGAEIESQTHRRLQEEKKSPDGESWQAWSDGYAQSRHSGHSLLMNEGELDDSIQFLVVGDEVHVGTNLIYAAIHQFGGEDVGKDIAARPYLGLSDENVKDIEALINDWADEQLGL
ncbi:MAG: phage virion morphogenesis protein [Oceanospirillaceae bacterium]|nr:phage virion morphogenesis protein [Oceanospirillaceae bacterium]